MCSSPIFLFLFSHQLLTMHAYPIHTSVCFPKGKIAAAHLDSTKEGFPTHLVVAALIATVTFAAGFTIPGGYQSEKGPEQGFAVLSKNAAFKAFVITNTLALCMSSFSVLMHLYVSMHTKRKGTSAAFDVVLYITMLALIFMVVAFITGTYAVLCHSPGLAITACVIGCFFFLILTHVTLSEISPPYQLTGLGLLFSIRFSDI